MPALSAQGAAATACARRAAREAAVAAAAGQRHRASAMGPSAPLPRAGFAVAGKGGRGDGKRGNAPAPGRNRNREHRDMAGQDSELDLFRNGVSCAALLERLPPPWRLDRRESTRRALKYRRGEGEILIVNHDGRGWWDPHSAAKGDVFDLVQHLDPSLNFGQVRQILRPFIGLSPTYPEPSARLSTGCARRNLCRLRPAHPPRRGRHQAGRRALERQAAAAPWRAGLGVSGDRAPPDRRGADRGRARRRGAARRLWQRLVRAPRRFGRGQPRRNPRPRLQRLAPGRPQDTVPASGNGNAKTSRLALTEAPIDALSLAALEHLRPDTLYAATGGGMGPGTVEAIERALAEIAGLPSAQLDSAVDANRAGEHYADRHAELAAAAGVPFARLPPTIGIDWNDTLRRRGI